MVHMSTLAQRLASKVVRTADGHLAFTGVLDSAGYGLLWDGRRGNNSRAHRVAWELRNGPIPPGMLVHHVCRMPSCCDPEHLELVTARAHTHHHRAAEVCVNGHLYDQDNTHYVRGQKVCRVCRADAAQRYRDRNRDAINERKRARRRAAAES